MSDWRSDAKPHVSAPPPGCTPGHPRPESQPFDWPLYVGSKCWVEFVDNANDWHGQRVVAPWVASDGRVVGLRLEPVPYHDAEMGGWCMTEVDGCGRFTIGFGDISSIRLLTAEEETPPVRDSRISNVPDDSHYAKLAVQPREAILAWSRHWPSHVAYNLGEAVAMLARCGTKGQMKRDLQKAKQMIEWALEGLDA